VNYSFTNSSPFISLSLGVRFPHPYYSKLYFIPRITAINQSATQNPGKNKSPPSSVYPVIYADIAVLILSKYRVITQYSSVKRIS